MTHDACSLAPTAGSTPSDGVVFGNGDSLPITRSSNLSFSSGSFVFCLSDVHRVHSLHKNLLSMAQFTRDHLVSITLFPCGYIIHDLKSNDILFWTDVKTISIPFFPHWNPNTSPVPRQLLLQCSSRPLFGIVTRASIQ